MVMEPVTVELGLFARPMRHDGAAVIVDAEHELGGFLLAVTEETAEHVDDVAHKVDRVIPDDDIPPGVEVIGRTGIDVRLEDVDPTRIDRPGAIRGERDGAPPLAGC